jgi:hypothetical protein
VPGYPSAIRLFARTHSRRIVVQRLPWLISFSLDEETLLQEGVCSRAPHSLPQDVVAIRCELPGINRVEAHRGGRPPVTDDLGVGFAARVDVCAAFPSARFGALRLFLLFHASVDDHCSVLFRASDTALFAVDTPKHLTSR